MVILLMPLYIRSVEQQFVLVDEFVGELLDLCLENLIYIVQSGLLAHVLDLILEHLRVQIVAGLLVEYVEFANQKRRRVAAEDAGLLIVLVLL